jgi:hypothetical protein
MQLRHILRKSCIKHQLWYATTTLPVPVREPRVDGRKIWGDIGNGIELLDRRWVFYSASHASQGIEYRRRWAAGEPVHALAGRSPKQQQQQQAQRRVLRAIERNQDPELAAYAMFP